MKSTIDSLVKDIYDLFTTDKFSPSKESIERFGQKLASRISNKIAEERGKPTLRLSMIGTPCDRKVWYQINHPEWAEPLRPEVHMKFLFGDILEEVLLFLASESGHTVVGEQDAVSVGGVVGHRDAIIDGRLIDVKTASTFSFNKFKNNELHFDDPFGYMDQLGSYAAGSRGDVLVTDHNHISFLAVDKQHGHLVLDTYEVPKKDYEARIESLRAVVARLEPPARSFGSEPDGASGNEKLPTYCSYCPFKFKCWPSVRTFLYANGPRFLVKVVREPNVPEART